MFKEYLRSSNIYFKHKNQYANNPKFRKTNQTKFVQAKGKKILSVLNKP